MATMFASQAALRPTAQLRSSQAQTSQTQQLVFTPLRVNRKASRQQVRYCGHCGFVMHGGPSTTTG